MIFISNQMGQVKFLNDSRQKWALTSDSLNKKECIKVFFLVKSRTQTFKTKPDRKDCQILIFFLKFR